MEMVTITMVVLGIITGVDRRCRGGLLLLGDSIILSRWSKVCRNITGEGRGW